MSELYGIIYKHGTYDYEIWQPDLPKEALDRIEAILNEYNDSGCSIRGTADDIKDELL